MRNQSANCSLIIGLALSLYVAILIGCAEHQNSFEPGGTSGSKVGEKGTLAVAIVPAPPISGIDPHNKQPFGYAVDVMNAVGHNSGLEMRYIPTEWATMGAALDSRRADVVIGPVFMTEGRAREYIFTDSIFAYAIVAVVATNNHSIRTVSDLQRAGLRIAVGRGGFDSEFVQRHMPDADVSVFPPDDPSLPMLEIAAGRADVALADQATAAKFVAEHPSTKLALEDDPPSFQYAAFMLRTDSVHARDFLNIAIRNLDLSGELAHIDSKYVGEKAWYGRVSHRPKIIR